MFDKRLKEVRKKKGYTQVTLAKKLAVSTGTVAMWETGKRKPDFEMLCTLSALLDVKTDYLLGQSDDDSSASLTDEEIDQLGAWETEEYLQELFYMYLSLDDYGKAAVNNLVKNEAVRCREQETNVKADGISISVIVEP
ncbi:MAG: helix-turn-helix domain-containing protein [Acetatifactor sp.]